MALLSKRLGIDPQSRMSFVTAKNGIQVWDLELEIEYTIERPNSIPVAMTRPVPEAVKALFELSNDELKARLINSGRSWNDEQSSIASELAYRGIKVG